MRKFIEVEGRMKNDIIIQQGPNGHAYGMLTLAHSFSNKDKEKETEWYVVFCSKEQAEAIIGLGYGQGDMVTCYGKPQLKPKTHKDGGFVYTSFSITTNCAGGEITIGAKSKEKQGAVNSRPNNAKSVQEQAPASQRQSQPQQPVQQSINSQPRQPQNNAGNFADLRANINQPVILNEEEMEID